MRVFRLQPRAEFIEADFQGFGTQTRHARRRARAPLDPAELAGVVIEQHSIIQGEDAVRMFAGLAFHQQFTRHARGAR